MKDARILWSRKMRPRGRDAALSPLSFAARLLGRNFTSKCGFVDSSYAVASFLYCVYRSEGKKSEMLMVRVEERGGGGDPGSGASRRRLKSLTSAL